jgi:hypothetical protein
MLGGLHQSPVLQGSLHANPHFIQEAGGGCQYIIPRPLLEGFESHRYIIGTCYHQDRGLGVAVRRGMKDVKTSPSGETNLCDNGVEMLLLELYHDLKAVANAGHSMPLVVEKVLESLTKGRIARGDE